MKKLIVLGTGVALVTKYYNTAFILEDSEEYILVDGLGGIDILRRFEDLHLNWNKLHTAYLSHEHTDHLLGMVWVLRYIAHLMRTEVYNGNFSLYCHEELAGKMDAICRMVLQPAELAFFEARIFIVPIEHQQKLNIRDYQFTFFDIESTKAKQFGFHLRYDDGKRLVFLGDEPLSDNGTQYCHHADWILSEAYCLYSEREIHTPYKYHHSTVKDAAQIANKFHAANLLLWHTEDDTFGRRRELYTQEARMYYSGNIYVPDDGEVILI